MEPGSIEARLVGLESTDLGYLKILREIVGRMALLTVAVKKREDVTDAELDEMLAGLEELHAHLARVGEFLPSVDD